MQLNGQTPRKDFENIYVAPNAAVIGDVDLIDLNSVWYGAVLRGDRNGIFVSIRIQHSIHMPMRVLLCGFSIRCNAKCSRNAPNVHDISVISDY
jgi:carbonic anhydrase/acetyltransferase-like protein (isoleucine patch superfamily)